MVSDMKDYLVALVPVMIMLVVYFIRLESRMAKICQDLHWIKRELRICRPPSENDSP